MDEHYAPRPIAGWYMVGAVAALLFMGLACVHYLTDVLVDPNSLPLDERTAYLAEPSWVVGAHAVAAWAGLAGAILLVMKRKLAEWTLALSLVGALAWVCGYIVIAPLRETAPAGDLLVAIVVTALIWTIFWFARHSRQRGWLK